MSDVLIRDVPDAVLAALDANAARMGLSRSEYLRRRLAQEVVDARSVTAADLVTFSATYADLGDAAIMTRAWE